MKEIIALIFNTLFTIGIVLAVIISWNLYQSILYSVLYGCLGWLYIIFHFGYYPLILFFAGAISLAILIRYKG